MAAAYASVLLISGTAQAALQDRDLNGDTVVDAFYDTELNITRLRDADVNGLMNWNAAAAWAAGFGLATHAMAVRDGDVAVLPEPQTHALMLAGSSGLSLALRRRRR